MPSKLSDKADRFDRDVLMWLDRHQGVRDNSGRATAKLLDPFMRSGDIDMKYGQWRLKQLTKEGLIEREVRGKRTFAITLSDKGTEWVRSVYRAKTKGTQHPGSPGETPQDAVSDAEPSDPSPTTQHGPKTPEKAAELPSELDYSTLASELLTQAAKAITHRDDQVQLLRRELRELRDRQQDHTSVAVEATKLRGRVEAAERQLEEARRDLRRTTEQLASANQRIRDLTEERDVLASRVGGRSNVSELLTERDRAAVARLMRELPASAAG